MRKTKVGQRKKEKGRRMVNIYGEKENIDKEYGREGIRWVGVSNENEGESNSQKYKNGFRTVAQQK
jgi:hypothetical protein